MTLRELFEPMKNPPDVITIDVPLLIRLLEWAKEEAESDIALHVVATNLVRMQSNVLSMKDYEEIITMPLDVD